MYFGGSVAGKASTIGRDISPIPPLIFTGGGHKVHNLASFKTSLNSEPPAFENAARYAQKKWMLRWLPYVLAKFGEVGSTHPEKAYLSEVSCAPPLKLHGENVLKRQ